MLDEGADLIANSAVDVQGFFLGFGKLGQAWGVFKTDVKDLGFAGKEGTAFVSVVADGDDIIEGDMADFVEVFGAVAGDVYAGFGHDPDGHGVETVGFDAGGIGFDAITFEMASPALGHLASAGVSCAQEEDAKFFWGVHGCFCLPDDFLDFLLAHWAWSIR